MSANDSSSSPELDLLQRLATGDLPLHAAIGIFPRIDRAKKAVEVCVRSETVELISKRDGAETAVQPWRLRFVLNDPGTWDSGSVVSDFHLRFTADACKRFKADSQAFLQDIFQHQIFQA